MLVSLITQIYLLSLDSLCLLRTKTIRRYYPLRIVEVSACHAFGSWSRSIRFQSLPGCRSCPGTRPLVDARTKGSYCPIHGLECLFDTITKLSTVAKKRLLIDIAAIRENYSNSYLTTSLMPHHDIIWQTFLPTKAQIPRYFATLWRQNASFILSTNGFSLETNYAFRNVSSIDLGSFSYFLK